MEGDNDMNIREQLDQAKSPEEMDRYLLDLDSEFRFKCRRCGKCCKNQDTILFTPRDISTSPRSSALRRSRSLIYAQRSTLATRPEFRWSIWCPLGSSGVVHCYCMTDAAGSTTVSLPSVRSIPWGVWVYSRGSRIRTQRLPGRI